MFSSFHESRIRYSFPELFHPFHTFTCDMHAQPQPCSFKSSKGRQLRANIQAGIAVFSPRISKVAQRTNLEETLAALAGAHSVVLAGRVIAAHRAQPLHAQGPPAGSRRCVVHKVVAVGELERVRKSHSGLLPEGRGAQNPGAVQRLVRPRRVQVHGHMERSVKFHLAGGQALAAVLRVFEGKQRESG